MGGLGRDRDGPPILVIGFGNAMRRDDGVGPRAASAVAGWGLPGVEALALHQLTPELAEPLASAGLAVFVDARLASEGEPARLDPVPSVASLPGASGHHCEPGALLAMALALFGRRPEAFQVTIPATDLRVGEGLSPDAARGLAEALRMIRRLLCDRDVFDG